MMDLARIDEQLRKAAAEDEGAILFVPAVYLRGLLAEVDAARAKRAAYEHAVDTIDEKVRDAKRRHRQQTQDVEETSEK